MGVVAGFESAPADLWPVILARIAEAGITVAERGEEAGLLWCSCRRGGASLGLAIETAKPTGNVCLYCNSLRYWTRPRATRRLFRDVLAAVRRCVGPSAARSPWLPNEPDPPPPE